MLNSTQTLLLQGLALTLTVTLCSLLLGIIAAVMLCYGTQSPTKCIRHSINAYVTLIRGTPVLLQLFFVYYGLSQSTWIQHSILWPILKNPIGCGILTLSNNSMAYVTNLLTGIINNQPKELKQAAKNMGFNHMQLYCSLQLPYAAKLVVPYYKNEIIMLLKSSSLISTITCTDLTGAINQIVSVNYQNLKWYGISALLYLLISVCLCSLYQLLTKFITAPQRIIRDA